MRRNRYAFTRHSSYNLERSYHNVPFEEFMFYNGEKNIIDKAILTKIYDDVIQNRKSIFWSNEELGNIGIGFRFSIKELPDIKKFCQRDSYDDKEEKNNENTKREGVYIDIIDFGTPVPANTIKNTKDIIRNKLFLGFEVDEDTKLLFQLFDFETIPASPQRVFISLNELINFFIENKYLNKYRLNSDWKEFKGDVNTLLGVELGNEPFPDIIEENYNSSTDTTYIIDVIEKRLNNINYRIGIILPFASYYCKNFSFLVVSEKDESYNYIDKNRVFFTATSYNITKNIFFDEGCNRYNNKGNIEINRDVISRIHRDIGSILSPQERVITARLYNFYYERFGERHIRVQSDKTFDALKKQYTKLISEGREIQINNIIISKKKIKLKDEFSIQFSEDFLDVEEKLTEIRSAINVDNAQYNLNVIYENILKLSMIRYIQINYTREHTYKEFKKVQFILNGMTIKIEKVDNRIHINGIFCRIDDTYSILCRAICYTKVDEYNRFIKDVSHIGVEWRKLINNGVHVELINPFYDIFRKTGKRSFEKIILRFSLSWDEYRRTKVYLLANNTKYLIRYKGKFKRYLGTPDVVTSMESLKVILTECLGEFDPLVFVTLIHNAIKEGEIVKKRGEELVTNTIRDIMAEETTIEIQGNNVKGYKIVGRLTQVPYFINAISLEVYKFTDGQWNRRCVVDDPNKQRIFEDRLANRLVNIYNEYRGISTIQN